MSKMNELATMLDDLTEVGQRLVACGEELIKSAIRVKDCFTAGEDEPQSPETVSVQETAAAKTYTKEEIRAMLADLSQSGFRDEAKALVKKYADGGSLTDIDPARYPELAEEAQKYHA